MTIKVEEREDGSFDVDWNPNDPVESILNDWTEEDFIQALQDHLNKLKNEKDA
jgi:hypothetical protein